MQIHRHDLLMTLSNAMRLTKPSEAPVAITHHLSRALSLADRHFREGREKGQKRRRKR